MGVGRKQCHLEMVGGKTHRQRIWERLRASSKPFTVQQLAWELDLDLEVTRYYIRALTRAGHVAPTGEKPVRCIEQRMVFVNEKDCGVEAPSLTRDGKPRKNGFGTEAMWRSLRILGEVTPDELAAQASVSSPTTRKTAYDYLLWLERAGYVIKVAPGTTGPKAKQGRYRLAPGKYTGPFPPMIQRVGQLFDPNLGQVVYSQQEGAGA